MSVNLVALNYSCIIDSCAVTNLRILLAGRFAELIKEVLELPKLVL